MAADSIFSRSRQKASSLSFNSPAYWIIHATATHHMTYDSSEMYNCSTESLPDYIRSASGSCLRVTQKGSIYTRFFSVHNVLHVPDLSENLLSVSQLADDGYEVVFQSKYCIVRDPSSDHRTVGIGLKKGGIYVVEEIHIPERSQVLPFGNGGNGENVPYTIYFDGARKDKKGGEMNPNSPLDNHDMFSGITTPVRVPTFHEEVELKGHEGTEVVRPNHEHHTSLEDADLRKLTDSSLHHDNADLKSGSSKSESEDPKGKDAFRSRHERQLSRKGGDMRRTTDSPMRYENAGWRATVDSLLHHVGMICGDTPKRVARQSVGSDCSFEHPPLHQHYQAGVGGRGSAGSSP